MKTTTRTIAPAVIALLCLALPNWARANDETGTPKASSSQEMGNKMQSNQGAPEQFNKASGLLGMDVRNQSDEHLGHIKDVVIDWKTERVSYAVINTGPKVMLGIDEKLLAVPLTALTVGPDGKYLILNADKSKVQAAAGFNPKDWPSVSSPSWGAQPVWQQNGQMPAKGSKDDPNSSTKPESESNMNEK